MLSAGIGWSQGGVDDLQTANMQPLPNPWEYFMEVCELVVRCEGETLANPG
jgi:hypothetical protein